MEKHTMSSSATIKRIRSELNYTQFELGAFLAVSKTAIYKWEQAIMRPTLDNINKLLKLARSHKIKIKMEDFLND